MTSCASKTVKAMAMAAASASKMSAPTFGRLSSSIEIDESGTGLPAGFVAAGLGAMATLTGAGLALAGVSAEFLAGLARTTGGLLGLLLSNPSEEGLAVEGISGIEASVDSRCSASGAGLAWAAPSRLESVSGFSALLSF